MTHGLTLVWFVTAEWKVFPTGSCASVGRLLKLLGEQTSQGSNRLSALPRDGGSVAFPGFAVGSGPAMGLSRSRGGWVGSLYPQEGDEGWNMLPDPPKP